MTVAGILSAVAALSGAALTNAAWLDDEYVHARGVGTDGKCELNSGTISTASARQLSGTLLSYNLDNLASVQGVQVSNDGGGTSTANPGAIRIDDNTFMAPLDVDLLNNDLLQFSLPLGLPIGAADVHSQWSQTLNNGNTTAASGLVTNSGGAISLGQPQDPVNPPVMAALDLGALAPTALSSMTLEVGSASSIARATQCGDIGNSWLGPLEEPLLDRAYSISSLDLQATLLTLGTAVSGTTELLDGVQASLDAASEAMQVSISEDLALAAVPLLGNLTLGSVNTQVTMSRVDLTPLRALLHGTMTDDRGLLTVDFGAGTLRVDLAKTAGGVNGLNGLDPNTEIVLNQAMMDELTAAFTQVLNDWQENIASALIDAIRATSVSADSAVHVLSEGVSLAEIRLGLGPTSVGQLLNLHNDVPGTPAVPVTTSVRLLGLDPLGLLSPTLQDLESGLASALPGIVGEALNEELVLGITGDVKTSVATLTGPVGASVSSALDELSSLLSIMVNVQPDKPGHPEPSSAGPFQISALHLSLFGLDVLDLSVATSTVGYGT
ncbi:choice-of-anchor G family protein [Arthrobacter sp.]|uniref:choice-of-anchor G family protein n=1 Tax=Arthrobacter sp. TaxID=1667 RepID=UPI002811ADF6|nr:choice-of-anchor G family protein [Arthrobacter sp.]